MRKTWHLINIIILFSLVIVPLGVLASIPTTTSFDRHNVYETDGFRAGGYYVIRQNSTYDGFMNMSYTGGTNNFNITTYNIENITLDFDLMYQERSYLFGWATVTWEDAVSSLGETIYITINSDDGINSLRFVDQPNERVRIKIDGEIYRDYAKLEDVEIDLNGIESGTHLVVIEFDHVYSIYNILIGLFQIAAVIGIITLIIRYIRVIISGNDDYYMEFWGE